MENKFSIVIPTMYKCPEVLVQLLSNLHQDPYVSEVILIENVAKELVPNIEYPENSRIKVVPLGKNIYVNPSWNLGVSMCTEEYIGILNDDITIPDNLFTFLSLTDFTNIGILGACDFLIQEVRNPDRFQTRYSTLIAAEDRLWGFGVMMIMKKDRYYSIPEDLLIWCGDDYLFHKNKQAGKQNAVILCPIQTRMSTTSNNPEYDKIKKKDEVTYNLKYKV